MFEVCKMSAKEVWSDWGDVQKVSDWLKLN